MHFGKRRFNIGFMMVLLFPLLTGFLCTNSKLFGNDEMMAYYEDQEKTYAAETLEEKHALQTEAVLPSETPQPTPTPTLTPTATPAVSLPEGITWESLVGLTLPSPPGGTVHPLNNCDVTQEIKIEDLTLEEFQAYLEQLRKAGWVEIEIPNNNPNSQVVGFEKGSEMLKLTYFADTGILFLTKKQIPEVGENLVLPGGRTWPDVISETVPAPGMGVVTMNQEVTVEGKTVAKRVVIEQITPEMIAQWILELEGAGWVQQGPEFAETYQQAVTDVAGPSIKPAEEMANFYGAPSWVFFTSSVNDMMLELVYSTTIAVLTMFMP